MMSSSIFNGFPMLGSPGGPPLEAAPVFGLPAPAAAAALNFAAPQHPPAPGPAAFGLQQPPPPPVRPPRTAVTYCRMEDCQQRLLLKSERSLGYCLRHAQQGLLDKITERAHERTLEQQKVERLARFAQVRRRANVGRAEQAVMAHIRSTFQEMQEELARAEAAIDEELAPIERPPNRLPVSAMGTGAGGFNLGAAPRRILGPRPPN